MWEAVTRHLPLDQYSYEAEGGPDAQNDPAVPAQRRPGREAQAVIYVIGKSQHLHKVISAHGHDSSSEHGRGEHGEGLLPLQRQHSKQHAGAQQRAQRHPERGRRVELVSDQQAGQSQQESQQQASHEEADASHQHGDQAAQQADAEADACAGLHAQLSVQNVLLVAQQEDDDRAEHETGQEHDGLETAVT